MAHGSESGGVGRGAKAGAGDDCECEAGRDTVTVAEVVAGRDLPQAPAGSATTIGVGRSEASGCGAWAAAAGPMKAGTQSRRQTTIAALTTAESCILTD
jgi:hypothetical protein